MKEKLPERKSSASRIIRQRQGPTFLDSIQTITCEVNWDSICGQWILEMSYSIVKKKSPALQIHYSPICNGKHLLSITY